MNKVLLTLVLGLISLSMAAKDRLVIAKAPTGIELKHDFEVKGLPL